MILSHDNKTPLIDPGAYVAPNAIVCGDVKIGPGSRIMFGACIVAEGKPIQIGSNCIVMENAILRSTDEHPLSIGQHCLIGPHAHIAGCAIADEVFIATGASVLHGARLGKGVEVQVNGVVQLRTELQAGSIVPIGWVAVGSPAAVLPAEKHEEIWAIQRPLDFPGFVYGVSRGEGEQGMPGMTEITLRRSEALARHRHDKCIS